MRLLSVSLRNINTHSHTTTMQIPAVIYCPNPFTLPSRSLIFIYNISYVCEIFVKIYKCRPTLKSIKKHSKILAAVGL